MKYLPTVGLEIHSHLATETKIFCGCSTGFGGEPNSHSCPVCLGMPGVLPVLNRRTVELAMRLALRVGGEIRHRSYFARKNYFYPDLPKGYQISMFEYPLIRGGCLEVDTPGGTKFIRLNRIHLEEDAGKLIHQEGHADSYFDVNRCGVPLVEIVTEPDFESLDDISRFLNRLKEILVFSGVSRGNMEQGDIRVDANISIRPEGQKELGTRTEIKNMNSFANVVSAVSYEIDRQTGIVETGGTVVQETLLYDADNDRISPMRSKEEAHDYRYFPEPDLVPIVVSEEWIERVRSELPPLKDEFINRFKVEYMLPDYDSETLAASPDVAVYLDDMVKAGGDPKKSSNWVLGKVLETKIDINEFRKNVPPDELVKLQEFTDDGTISGSIAKMVFDDMAATGKSADVIIKSSGLTQISNRDELEKLARGIIEANPKEVEKYRAGKKQVMGFFVGQVMKLTKGKANPQEVNAIFRELLS